MDNGALSTVGSDQVFALLQARQEALTAAHQARLERWVHPIARHANNNRDGGGLHHVLGRELRWLVLNAVYTSNYSMCVVCTWW